jgi:hypothetical protein
MAAKPHRVPADYVGQQPHLSAGRMMQTFQSHNLGQVECKWRSNMCATATFNHRATRKKGLTCVSGTCGDVVGVRKGPLSRVSNGTHNHTFQ